MKKKVTEKSMVLKARVFWKITKSGQTDQKKKKIEDTNYELPDTKI